MTHRTLRRATLTTLLLAGFAWCALPAAAADEAPATGIGVTLLLPPNALAGFELEEAYREMKAELRAAGFEVVAEGEYNPDQKLEMVKKGKVTGLVAHEPGDEALAEQVRGLLLPRYPELVVEPAPKRNSPFPEGTLGLLVPSIVIVVVKEEEPPPWKIYLEDISVDIDGAMSAAEVRGLFEDHKQDLIACWPKAVMRGKRMEGTVLAKVTVDPGGEPVISSILQSPGLGELWVDCVSEAYLDWAFPATTDGRSAKVTLGVRFVLFDIAGGDEAPAAEPADEATAE